MKRLIPAALLVATTLPASADPTVVIFMIDGLQPQPARVAAANGATNIKFILDNGVGVNETYCTSPAPYTRMPDGSLPWGTTTSSNIAMHTGTHVFDSRRIDDIFLSATRSGIRSVFAGGAGNYTVFDTATYRHVSGSYTDRQIVDFGIQRIRDNNARLVRLHLQRIRDAWSGPAASTNPSSAYQAAIRNADAQLGRLINTLKSLNRWNETYIIIGSDHGMSSTSSSDHPPRFRSSWTPFMAFYGPGLKKGATIPYAEGPDVALMAAHFLGVERPRGYTDNTPINPRTPTATFLSNLFEGAPDTLAHPQYIRRYLVARNWAPPEPYTDYRAYMLSVIGGTPTATPTPRATPRPSPTPTPTPIGGQVDITPGAAAVTASTHDGNVPANAVDNNLGTRWSASGDGQWIRFDLGAPVTVSQVRIAWYNGNARRSSFDIQVSPDGTDWSASWRHESSGTTTQEETFDIPDTAGRYVRYLGHGNTVNAWNSVTEVSIFRPGP